MKRKDRFFLTCICALALFFCVFRVKETYILAEDVARDTLKILTMWQNKENTLIGPPASFSLTSDNKFYFGSFSYYLGLLGLLLSSFDPVGAAIPTIFLFIVSIPFFYRFCGNIQASKLVKVTATVLYGTSPLIISHMRFYWNPNPVIPLSVFFWYLVTLKNKKKVFEIYFPAGLVMAVIFNLHYFNALPMLIWTLIVMIRKNWDKIFGLIFGFFIGSLPLLIHEVTSEFSLTKALIENMGYIPEVPVTWLTVLGRMGEIFTAVLGLKHGEIYFPAIFGNKLPGFWLVWLLIFGLAILTIIKNLKEKRVLLSIPLFITIIFAAIFSNTVFYARYVFGAVPLVIWFLAEMFDGKIQRFLWIPVMISVIVATFGILIFQNSISTGYIPVKILEKVSEAIVKDEFKGNYNLTENIDVDGHALALRYYVLRDSSNKPQGIGAYDRLDRVYVMAPSLERIRDENKFEYYASGPWKDPMVTDFGEIKLFRFDK